MAVDVESVALTVGGGLLGLGATVAQVDVNIDAPFVIALGAVLGGAAKWIHGLLTTRKLYRQKLHGELVGHEKTLEVLSAQMSDGFKAVTERLDSQDTLIAELKAQSDSVFGLLVDHEKRTNARFDSLGG